MPIRLTKERSTLTVSTCSLMQIAQRRIAGAEIVDAPLDAHRLQALQRDSRGGTSPMNALSVISSFRLDGVQPGLAQNRLDLARQIDVARTAGPTR